MKSHAKNAHKAAHHHHKNEMEHHKLRDKHHAAHMANMKKGTEDGIDLPTKDSDNHQQGIERVKQKAGSMPVGQHGSMAGGWSHKGVK